MLTLDEQKKYFDMVNSVPAGSVFNVDDEEEMLHFLVKGNLIKKGKKVLRVTLVDIENKQIGFEPVNTMVPIPNNKIKAFLK